MKRLRLVSRLVQVGCALFWTNVARAQTNQSLWTDVAAATAQKAAQAPLIQPSTYRTLKLDEAGMRRSLSGTAARAAGSEGAGIDLDIPLADGSFLKFRVQESSVMAPELAAKFPSLRTYTGYSLAKNSIVIKADFTEQGFHAMILDPEGNNVFIDPFGPGSPGYYMSYYRKDFVKQGTSKVCTADQVPANIERQKKTAEKAASTANRSPDRNLRTYRLAVAATYEYTQFHGGTKSAALSAIVTSINRVNGLFERDVALRMVLIGGNDRLIYTSSRDPYTNNDGDAMLSENITNTNAVIGSANYDIGHVFSTGGGGVAYLGFDCSRDFKAGGVTGSSRPVGDPFDVDFVAHEIGHQFGATHTQGNDCNRRAISAFEPGSGSTIMSYAGICAPNVTALADAMFHGISIQQMTTYVSTTGSSGGNDCAAKTPLTNSIPTANAGSDYLIPRGTPFKLTGSATDADGLAGLTYSWEQMNNEAAAMPPAKTATAGPAFRVYLPATTPSRTFPRIQDIAANATPTWEVLSDVGRSYNFRLVVRDNKAGGGFTNYDEARVTVAGNAGPFRVTAPNTAVSWVGNSTQTVTWSVAGSNVAPVSCANVNILLSTDGGITYPVTIASRVPNTGSATIKVPNNATTRARIRVEAAGNIFFDISNANFTITPGSTAPPSGIAVTYPECGYGGLEIPLAVGEYTTLGLEDRYIYDNDLSSLKIASGYEVQVFDGDNFTGASLVIGASTDCLTASGWNNRTSSLKVRAVSAPSSTLIQAEAYSAMQGVRTEATTDTGGGLNVAYVDAGDFMRYDNIRFSTSGAYRLEYRVASPGGGTLSADLNNGATPLRSVSIPATGGWQTWRTVSQTVTVTAGTYSLRILAQTRGWNLNWLRISKAGTGARGALAAAATTGPAPADGAVELYPNPVVDKLYLASAATLAGGHYRILNGWGKPLTSGALAEGPLDVAALPAGVYTLVLVSKGGQTTTRRFIK